MKYEAPGVSTSLVEVCNISTHGFWLWLDTREIFLPFAHFPWFRDATIAQIMRVERPTGNHLYWPELDIDLAVQSIEHPERFPLVSKLPLKKSPEKS